MGQPGHERPPLHQGAVRVRLRAAPQARRACGPGRTDLSTPLAGTVTGIVLAGGRSSRFGRDKLIEPYRGMPLLHHAVLHLGEVCDEIVVVIAPGAPEPDLPIGLAPRVVRDATEGEGPLAGASAGLMAVRSDVALLAGGDMPETRPAVLLELVRVLAEARVDGAALRDGEGVRPLPSALRTGPARDAAHALLHSGARRLGDLLDALRVAAIDEPTWRALDPDGATLRDVDRPEDLDG